jgi:hypothetical protein
MRGSQRSHRDRPSISSRVFEVIRVFRVAISHEIDEKPDGGSSLGMANKVDLILHGPLPLCVFPKIICEQNRPFSVCGFRFFGALVFRVHGSRVKKFTIVNVQVVTSLHFHVTGVVGNESVTVSIKRSFGRIWIVYILFRHQFLIQLTRTLPIRRKGRDRADDDSITSAQQKIWDVLDASPVVQRPEKRCPPARKPGNWSKLSII